MKKFKFHLGKLLDYKGQNLDNEKMVLAELNKELSLCERHLILLQKKLLQKQQDYEQALLASIAPSICQMHRYYIEAVNEEIKTAQEAFNSIKKKVESQIEVVKNLKLETRSLEVVKEKKYEEYKQEVGRKSERELEEFIATSTEMKKSFRK